MSGKLALQWRMSMFFQGKLNFTWQILASMQSPRPSSKRFSGSCGIPSAWKADLGICISVGGALAMLMKWIISRNFAQYFQNRFCSLCSQAEDPSAWNCWTFYFGLHIFWQAWLNIFYFFKAQSGWSSTRSTCRLWRWIKGKITCAAGSKNWKF